MTLIDKAALLNKIATEVHYDSEHSLEMYAKLLSEINDAPTVDAVPTDFHDKCMQIEIQKRFGMEKVVRCKDCTRYAPFKDVDGVCLAHNTGVLIVMSQNGYCNLGERREDAETN